MPSASQQLPGLDALVHTSVWVALAAAALCAAASRALGAAVDPLLLGFAACGTLVVYTVDRLRDRVQDQRTAPERSAFVERLEPFLRIQVGLAGLVAGLLGIRLGARTLALAAAVALLGLWHRRLKHRSSLKPLYLTAAWTAVAVGLPLTRQPGAQGALPVAAAVAGAVLSNVVLSNARDGEGAVAGLGLRQTRAVAALPLLPASAAALLGPPAAHSLLALPVAMAAAVVGFRPSERYGAWVVDGALLVGALAALLLGR